MATARPTLTALTTVAILAAASGCGGGSKSLSRSELIAKADPICKRAIDKLASGKITQQNIAQLAPGIAAVERQVSTELAKLTPPSSMADDWKVIVDGFRRAGLGLTQAGEAAKAKDHTRLIAGGNELTSGEHDRAITATRDGFKVCSTY